MLSILLLSVVSEIDKDNIQTYHQQNITHIASIKVGATITSTRQLA